jgi:RNA ligase (TIGR02306 family)
MKNINSVCYISKVTEIKKIEGADNIEQVMIQGWSCVTKKGLHTVGDLVVCATTDAVIPTELATELGIQNYLRNGNRVRTVKLKGVYSECLIIPINFVSDHNLKDGDDCMDILNIQKYEPPAKMIRLSNGKTFKYDVNPNFKIYYKFPNFKNVPNMFDEDSLVQITRKIHGTNARFGVVRKSKLSILDRIKKFFGFKLAGYEFVVGSHNVEKGSDSQGFYDTNVWYDIANKYDIKNKLINYVNSFKYLSVEDTFGEGITIYGEIYGMGIQKGYDYGLNDVRFAVFDIMIGNNYVGSDFVSEFCNEVDLPTVEVLYEGLYLEDICKTFILNNYIENLPKGKKIPHEGIVVKCISGSRDRVAKIINPEYLIFSEKHNVGDSH